MCVGEEEQEVLAGQLPDQYHLRPHDSAAGSFRARAGQASRPGLIPRPRRDGKANLPALRPAGTPGIHRQGAGMVAASVPAMMTAGSRVVTALVPRIDSHEATLLVSDRADPGRGPGAPGPAAGRPRGDQIAGRRPGGAGQLGPLPRLQGRHGSQHRRQGVQVPGDDRRQGRVHFKLADEDVRPGPAGRWRRWPAIAWTTPPT